MEQDYYNDHQNMVRSADIESVIDKFSEWRGRDCRTREQIRCHMDVAAVLDAIYAACPESYPALIRLASICASLTPRQYSLLVHVLRNGTFSEYAIGDGTTPAAVGQRWATMVRACPDLAEVKRR